VTHVQDEVGGEIFLTDGADDVLNRQAFVMSPNGMSADCRDRTPPDRRDCPKASASGVCDVGIGIRTGAAAEAGAAGSRGLRVRAPKATGTL